MACQKLPDCADGPIESGIEIQPAPVAALGHCHSGSVDKLGEKLHGLLGGGVEGSDSNKKRERFWGILQNFKGKEDGAPQ